MEFKVWVDGIERVISGVQLTTTCRDIVLCLAQATQQFGKFVLIEKWRQNERLLAPNELPIQILNKWADLANEVCFIMRRSDVHQQIQQQQQLQQQQQFINNEPLYSTVRASQVYNNNVLHPINQMNQMNQLSQMNPMNSQLNNLHQQIYYQQGNNQLPSNNMIYKQMKPNFNSQPQLDFNQQIYTTTKYSGQQIPQQLNSQLNLNAQLNMSPQLNLNSQMNINPQLNQHMNQHVQMNPNQYQQILHVQQPPKQIITIHHQHSPHNLQHSPLNQVYGQVRQIHPMSSAQQYSSNLIKMNNLMNNPVNQMNQMNQLQNLNQINNLNNQLNNLQQQQCALKQNLDLTNDQLIKSNRPKCPPPYKEAIAKSALLQNNSPVNTTSHSPSIYQQKQDYASQSQSQINRYSTNPKLNSVISNPNLISNRMDLTPSPNQQIRTNSQPNLKSETYYHVNVAQLKSKFDNNALDQKVNNTNSNLNVKTFDKKNFESSFQLEKENRNVIKQFKKETTKDSTKVKETSIYETLNKQINQSIDNLEEFNRSELNRSDYHISNYQTEQLEVLQKETERIEQEKNQIANNINETDLKIAKCRQKIQVLMDDIRDVSVEKENEKLKMEEEINLKQIAEIKNKIVQSIKEYELSSEKLNKLQNELDKLESTLNERKKMMEHLTTDLTQANIEGLTLVPLEDTNGNLLEDNNENKAPANENCELNENRFNIRLGSTRRCLKINGDGELPIQHPSGVWV